MKGLKFYIKDSIKNGYCLGAYNFVNMEVLKGIIDGCHQSNSPCFISVSEGALEYMNDAYVMALANVAKHTYKNLPVFLHLDHGKSYEICKKAIDLGFDSVMIDASSLDFEQNIALTKKVVDYAHAQGVLVEAELGVLAGIEDSVKSKKASFTDPDAAKEFVDKTKCDFLAVAIGTSHGAYKYSGKAKIRTDILSQIEAKLKNFPLVLHGASEVPQKYVKMINENGGNVEGAKGVDEKLLTEACTKHNVFKINTDTDIRLVYTACVRKYLAEHPENFDIRKPNACAQNEIAKFVCDKNTNVFHNNNRI